MIRRCRCCRRAESRRLPLQEVERFEGPRVSPETAEDVLALCALRPDLEPIAVTFLEASSSPALVLACAACAELSDVAWHRRMTGGDPWPEVLSWQDSEARLAPRYARRLQPDRRAIACSWASRLR